MDIWDIWNNFPGLEFGLPLPFGLKHEWIDQDGMPRTYETLVADDQTLCKRRRLNPKYENAYLEKDGTIKSDLDSVVAVQRIWLDKAYTPNSGVMYNKIKSRFTSECQRQQITSSSTK
jgi:hypothetical protein